MSCMPVSAVRDWSDAFIVMKRNAEESRGALQCEQPGASPMRWPRTTGADVRAIIEFLDPHVRRLLVEEPHGAALLEKTWRACLAEFFRWGEALPHVEYSEGRRFWSHVMAAAVHLSASAARLPTEDEWAALLACLRRPLRNGVPREAPFGPFEGIRGFDDLHIAQVRLLMSKRGFDVVAPEPGMKGGERSIPRATNADVIALRDFWGRQLAAAKKILEHDSVVQRWAAVSAEVDTLTRGADPNAVYPKNNAFWRVLAKVATQVHVADGSPSKAAQIVDSLKVGVTELPATLGTAAREVAGGVGSVASGAVRGLLGLSPLALGGGLLAAFLLLRNKRRGPSPSQTSTDDI